MIGAAILGFLIGLLLMRIFKQPKIDNLKARIVETKEQYGNVTLQYKQYRDIITQKTAENEHLTTENAQLAAQLTALRDAITSEEEEESRMAIAQLMAENTAAKPWYDTPVLKLFKKNRKVFFQPISTHEDSHEDELEIEEALSAEAKSNTDKS